MANEFVLIHFNRNLQLEDALAFAHSHISKEAHPLLSEASPKRPQDVPEVGKATEVLGTLAIGEAGEVKYFGPSAGTEVLFCCYPDLHTDLRVH
jgi:hypothetical protein